MVAVLKLLFHSKKKIKTGQREREEEQPRYLSMFTAESLPQG